MVVLFLMHPPLSLTGIMQMFFLNASWSTSYLNPYDFVLSLVFLLVHLARRDHSQILPESYDWFIESNKHGFLAQV